MAALADIAVYDGAVTPLLHTLKAEAVSRPAPNQILAEWREKLTGISDDAQASLTLTKTKLSSGVVRVDARYSVPVQEAITNQNAQGYTAPQKVAYVDTIVISQLVHPRSTVLSRRLAKQIAINHLNNVATAVTPISAGVLDDAMAQLIMPA